MLNFKNGPNRIKKFLYLLGVTGFGLFGLIILLNFTLPIQAQFSPQALEGSGSINYIPKFTQARKLGNSTLSDDGTGITLTGNISIGSGNYYSWSSRTKMYSDADGTIRFVNDAGTSFTALYLYNLYTDASNYDRFAVKSTASNFTLAAETLGDGADDIGLTFQQAGVGDIAFVVGGSGHLYLDGDTGALAWYTDNTYDIGMSRDDRPRDVYIGRNLIGVDGYFYALNTDDSNYERFVIDTTAAAANIELKAETLGSGTDNIGLKLTPAGTGSVIITSGALLPGSDNTVDLGGSGIEFRNLYIDGTANIDSIAGVVCSSNNNVEWLTRTELNSPEDGGLVIQNNDDDICRVRIYGSAKTLTESAATGIFTAACTEGEYIGGSCEVTVFATDGSADQCRHLTFNFVAINDAGTVSTSLSSITENVVVDSGSLTATITVTDSTSNSAQINVNAESSLTQSTLECRWQVRLNGSGGAVTAL